MPANSAWSAWLSLGNELSAQGDVGGAISCYRQAVLRNPASAEAHAQLGHALESAGRTEEAATQFQQALETRTGAGGGRPEPPREMPSH